MRILKPDIRGWPRRPYAHRLARVDRKKEQIGLWFRARRRRANVRLHQARTAGAGLVIAAGSVFSGLAVWVADGHHFSASWLYVAGIAGGVGLLFGGGGWLGESMTHRDPVSEAVPKPCSGRPNRRRELTLLDDVALRLRDGLSARERLSKRTTESPHDNSTDGMTCSQTIRTAARHCVIGLIARPRRWRTKARANGASQPIPSLAASSHPRCVGRMPTNSMSDFALEEWVIANDSLR